MNMRQFLGLLVFTLCGITSFLLSSGLPAGTPILQNNILVPIESLQIGTTITGYNPEDNSYPETKIPDLLPHEGSILVEIKTKHGSIFASPDQLFYDVHAGEFKKSAELSATSMLLDKELRQIQCHGIEIHENSPTTFCELSLEEPHLFFSSDQKILMHNAGMAIATAGEKAAPFVAKMLGNAAVISHPQSGWLDGFEQSQGLPGLM